MCLHGGRSTGTGVWRVPLARRRQGGGSSGHRSTRIDRRVPPVWSTRSIAGAGPPARNGAAAPLARDSVREAFMWGVTGRSCTATGPPTRPDSQRPDRGPMPRAAGLVSRAEDSG